MHTTFPALGLLAVLLAALSSGPAYAGEAVGPMGLKAVAVEDLDRISGLGIEPDEASAEMQTLSDGETQTTVSTSPLSANGISGSAFAGASGLVTSIQNLGDNVVIHNITNVTVNIR